MMNLHTRIIGVFAAAALAVSLGAASLAATDVAQATSTGLTIAPHAGAQAIDVSGQAAPGSSLRIALVATFSRDVPDVILSRKTVVASANGAFAATVPIAPGFFSGSILTVYARPSGSGPTLKATFSPEAPNHGTIVPADQIPESLR